MKEKKMMRKNYTLCNYLRSMLLYSWKHNVQLFLYKQICTTVVRTINTGKEKHTETGKENHPHSNIQSRACIQHDCLRWNDAILHSCTQVSSFP